MSIGTVVRTISKRALIVLLLSPLLAPAPSEAQERLNRTVETLAEGQAVFGIFSGDQSVANARALARSGLDYVFIDMEHNPWDVETLRLFLLGMTDRAEIARTGSLQMAVTPIVRIPQNGGEMLQFLAKQALDMGVFGVMFPFINNREEALNAIASMRYPRPLASDIREPHGIRGRSPQNAVWYWGISGADYFQRADVWPLDPQGELLAVLQIETPEGVANAEEIITTPGLGALFIGPSDLAAQMGYGDNPGAPEVEEAIQSVLEICLRHDVPCGLTTAPGNIEERTRQGFRFVTVGGDGGITPSTAEALERGRAAAGRN